MKPTKEQIKKAIARNQKFCLTHYFIWLKRQTERDWGEKCPDYDKNCAVCLAWKMWSKLKGRQ